MKCNVCQFEIPGEYKFCPNCGAGIASSAPQPTTTAPAQGATPAAPVQTATDAVPAQAATPVAPVQTATDAVPAQAATDAAPVQTTMPTAQYPQPGVATQYPQAGMAVQYPQQVVAQAGKSAEAKEKADLSFTSTSALCGCVVAIIAMLTVRIVYEGVGNESLSGYVHAFRIDIAGLVVAIGFTIFGMVQITKLCNKKFMNVRTVIGFVALVLAVMLIGADLMNIGERYDKYRLAVNINKVANYYEDKNEKRESANKKMQEYNDAVEQATAEIMKEIGK